MNNKKESALWDEFFSLKTIGGLKKFLECLDVSIPEQAAISYYIMTWPDFIHGGNKDVFLPGNFVSRDRSAIMFGEVPVIFEGTNNWAWKSYYPVEDLIDKISLLNNKASRLRNLMPDARMSLVLVPEKDYLISQFLLKEDRFSALNEAIASMHKWLKDLEITLVYEKPFLGINEFQTCSDFEYEDSHLPGRNYVSIFGTYLADLGLPWAKIHKAITLNNMPNFGDLTNKFDWSLPGPVPMMKPNFSQSKVIQTAGTKTFAEPLGDTWQKFFNEEPLVDQSICLLGDSHCSIYERRNITYLCANTFRDTYFEWNPCGIRKNPDIGCYDYVLLEISSRFIV